MSNFGTELLLFTLFKMDEAHETTSLAQQRRSKLSYQQKTILHRFMDQNPRLKLGKFSSDFTHHSAQRLWTKIATQLNSVPGARKTWNQWRKTWQDLKTNSRKSELQECVSDEVVSQDIVFPNIIPQDSVFNEVLSESDNSKDEDDTSNKVHVKRQRAKNMSQIQKKLLYNLVNSNDNIKAGKNDSSVTFDVKRKEWKRIASKLNSLTGPKKSWSQWKKCWHDIRKYYIRDEAIERVCNSGIEDIEIALMEETNNDRTSNIASASQLNCMVQTIAQRPETVKTNDWLSLCTKLNSLGPQSKTELEWRKVWSEYKSKVKKLVDRNGLEKCNRLQRLTYVHIQREGDKDVHSTIESTLTDNRLQILDNTAEHECNIVGSLVAVKLRSMRKEQKLIAEKLISEILFQGQMEMFQFSDKAVSIPGYTS